MLYQIICIHRKEEKNEKIKMVNICQLCIHYFIYDFFAAEWKQDNSGWWYQNDDGSYPINTWKEIDGKQYYFGNDG